MKKWIIVMLVLGSISLAACKNQEITKQEVPESLNGRTSQGRKIWLSSKFCFIRRKELWKQLQIPDWIYQYAGLYGCCYDRRII